MKGHPIRYSDDELAYVEANATLPRAELHRRYQAWFARPEVTVGHLKALCKRRGWTTGRTGRFEKGQVPPNKGRTMPYNANSARTRFQKGQRPHTWRGPGHERVDAKDGYVVMIVAETNPWTGADTRPVQKHRYLWEQANGPVPEGHVLKCLDGDKTNTNPSNWEAIPQAMLPRLNGRYGRDYDSAPPELKPVILATTKLEHAARELRKGRRK